MVCATSKASYQPAQSDQSLCYSLEYSLSVKLPTEHHLEFLSLKGGFRGSTESTHVKMPHCWKSHGMAHQTVPGNDVGPQLKLNMIMIGGSVNDIISK